ncbi:MAG: hypothetical protein H0V32_13610 [Nocardioidaceae bacterium]|jgi:hypothetical protein|nr:hypothetical protein [Nocardioidaceae bacterium]MDQ3324318.1 hypothetical protein [Actinomycetota bacterium]
MLSAVVRAEEELRELPIDPVWVGVIVLGLLLAMLVALLVFGKGRPHS